MAVVAVFTRWWSTLCMRCGATWGIYLFDPGDEEPFCYLCGVNAIVNEESSEDVQITLRMRDKGA
jgi:hypothetical protein